MFAALTERPLLAAAPHRGADQRGACFMKRNTWIIGRNPTFVHFELGQMPELEKLVAGMLGHKWIQVLSDPTLI